MTARPLKKKHHLSHEERDALTEFVKSPTYSLVISEIDAIISRQEEGLLSFRVGKDNERELLFMKLQLDGAKSLASAIKLRFENARLASSSALKNSNT